MHVLTLLTVLQPLASEKGKYLFSSLAAVEINVCNGCELSEAPFEGSSGGVWFGVRVLLGRNGNLIRIACLVSLAAFVGLQPQEAKEERLGCEQFGRLVGSV